jgi:threonylcarbamoyladenosine tRNA methylthiotransferase MtaB
VGFPGETEAAFQNSFSVLKKIGFCKVHIFPYSVRENTIAASFKGKVPKEIIISRAKTISCFFAQAQIT